MKISKIIIMAACTMACSYGGAEPASPSTRKPYVPDMMSKRIIHAIQSGAEMDQKQALEALEEAGGRYSERKMRGEAKITIDLPTKRMVGDEIPALASRIPGVQILALGTPSHLTDTGLGFIKEMSGLEMLTVTGREISDAGVAQLCGLDNLFSLQLNNTAITDDGLKQLSKMKNLQSLAFRTAENITDEGWGHLASMENLQMLSISHSPVTDVGLVHLGEIESLKALFLVNTKVTSEAAKKLKERRPNLFLPKALTDPCEGSREILGNIKRRWAGEEKKEKGVQPTQADLMPLFDVNLTGGFSLLKCEDGGKISINPVGEPPSCSIHGIKQKEGLK